MNIRVFGTTNCPQCTRVTSYLKSKAVDFTYNTIGTDIEKDEVDVLIGRVARQAPVIVVNGSESSFESLKDSIEQTFNKAEISQALSVGLSI